MIRNDSITVWRISAEINCYFVKRSRLDPIRNFPTKSVKPKAVNSNPRHEHKFSQCLHSCLGDVMSPSLSVRSSSPLPASRSNWQDESLSSTPNARTHDNCICFVYSWTLFVFDVGGEPNPVPTLRLGGGLWSEMQPHMYLQASYLCMCARFEILQNRICRLLLKFRNILFAWLWFASECQSWT